MAKIWKLVKWDVLNKSNLAKTWSFLSNRVEKYSRMYSFGEGERKGGSNTYTNTHMLSRGWGRGGGGEIATDEELFGVAIIYECSALLIKFHISCLPPPPPLPVR